MSIELLKQNFNKLAQKIFEDYYLKPFNEKQVKADVYKPPIERISHGATHVSRVAGYIYPIIAAVYKNAGYQDAALLTDENILLLQYVALFHDAKRENDRGKDIWENASAAECYKFFIKHGLPEDKARQFSEFIKQQKPDNLLWRIFQSADALNIMRCKPYLDLERVSLYQDFQHDALLLKQTIFPLTREIRQCIAEQCD